jgi:diguanylate cyclase (GGDEF)-like protein/PAS domain S-box-containing protein
MPIVDSAIDIESESQSVSLKELLRFHIDKANFPVRVLQVNSRLRLYPRMVVSQLAIAFLLVGVMWNGVSHDVLLAWLAVACAVHSVEFAYWKLFHEQAKDIAQCRRWNTRFCWLSATVGIVWGSGGILMFVPGQLLYQMFLISVVLGISASAVTSNPVHPPSLFIHLAALVLPLVTRIFWEWDWQHLLWGTMFVVYLFYVVNAARELIATFEQSLHQGIENERLAAELEQAQSLAHIGSWHYVMATGSLSWTRELYRICGVTPETFIPLLETFLSLVHPDDQVAVRTWVMACTAGENPGPIEFRCVWPDGTIHHIEGQGELMLDAEGKPSHILGTGQDISERKAAEERINNLAFYDTLTQLPNRRLLSDRLDKSMAASKRSGHYGALLFLDLDNFKPLNDIHGHAVGDLLLREVAQRLTSCVRDVDTVARFGGDEFVIVLSELDADKTRSRQQALVVAEKICSTLCKPYTLKIQHKGKAETAVEHHCSTSVGVALFINHVPNAEDILKRGDMAMYQAKEAGGNQIRFYEEVPP